MKLELKHVAGYLNHKLKMMVVSESDIRKGETVIINGIDFKHDRLEYTTNCGFFYNHELKLILRPISDLTKDELNNLKNLYFYKEIVTNNISDLCFWWGNTTNLEQIKNVFEYLHKEHFDIHNLIENNLAIDINTL